MRWERVKLKMKSKPETPEGKKSPGRKGGIMGPGKRWGHTCNSIKNGRFLYVFGGYGKDNCQTNDVHVFDSSKQTWSKPMVKGIPPSPRDSHSCTAVGTSLFVFGGTDGKNPLKDLYILDTSTNTWIQPNLNGEGPAAREGHSAALIDHHLFIFGGCGKAQDESEEIYYNDLYVLDTTTLTWKKAATKGTPPTPRDSHTCSSWKNQIIVLGGEDASDYYLSDVYILDADTLEWKELNTSGQTLAPRAGHATVSFGKHLFVFGGFTDDRNLFDDLHVLNIETGVWTKVTAMGQGPSARFSMAGDCLDFKKGVLAFIGGCNENLEALDDMYYLHTEMTMENGQDEQRPEKFSLRKELKRKRQEHQILSNESEKEKDTPRSEFRPRPILPAPSPNNIPMGSDRFSLFDFKPSEEKIFEAKITDVFHYGYTIESNIEGKPLRGLLFSYKPGFAHAVHAYLTRKKLASEASVVKSRETRKPKLKIARAIKQTVKRAEDGQAHAVTDVESTAQGTAAEPLASPSNQPLASSEMYRQFMQPISMHTPSTVQPDPRHYIMLGFPASHSTQEVVSSPTPSQGGIYARQTLPTPANQGSQVPSIQGTEYQGDCEPPPTSVG
uniref:DCD domain-containing protein n=1 Tax=Araucaria cunninghamii TaxID=56994 RepID=A0A0D6R3K1_ARACU